LDEEGSLGKVEHIFRVIERKCQPANLLEVICTTHTPTKSEVSKQPHRGDSANFDTFDFSKRKNDRAQWATREEQREREIRDETLVR